MVTVFNSSLAFVSASSLNANNVVVSSCIDFIVPFKVSMVLLRSVSFASDCVSCNINRSFSLYVISSVDDKFITSVDMDCLAATNCSISARTCRIAASFSVKSVCNLSLVVCTLTMSIRTCSISSSLVRMICRNSSVVCCSWYSASSTLYRNFCTWS